jgi:hypothetical protein
MRGHSRSKNGVAFARLCPRIHLLVKKLVAKMMDGRVTPGHDEMR